jgi:Family of unknown function (DUF6445)
MNLVRHPDFRIQKLRIGREEAPLVVIDNLVANPDELVDIAADKLFADVANYYPGVRSKVPLTYQQFIIDQLRDVFAGYFGLSKIAVRFSSCHFSLITTPPDKLTLPQRIPHIDSVSSSELAFLHYLFKSELGGTAFYRHRATGYEYIDEARKAEYWRVVDEEQAGPNCPDAGYINGDTPLYEQIGRQDGVFNRMLIYRRNSLHSGSLARNFVPDPNPRTGRLSINGFLA